MSRQRVLAPGDEPEVYPERYGEDARLPLNNTAFRIAERHYKKQQADLSNVFDFFDLSRNSCENLARIKHFSVKQDTNSQIELISKGSVDYYTVEGVPGFVFIPGLFSSSEQNSLASHVYRNWITGPSNLDAIYDLVNRNLFDMKASSDLIMKKNGEESNTARALLDKIRWITLGMHYNWNTKEYDCTADPFPSLLNEYCKEIALKFCDYPDYVSEAGIINFYRFKDSLTGHVDRSEKNMSAPLVSISLGHSCIFLVGGATREDPVSAFYLRSGDVCILNKESRLFYHGVPRILESENTLDLCDEEIKNVMMNTRININIRQVN